MSRRRLVGVVLLCVCLLVVSVLTGHRLPLYDGVGAPDEPYRYVAPPRESLRTALPPSGASTSGPLMNGTNAIYAYLSTDEVGPQITVLINAHALKSAVQATQLTLSATPTAPLSNISTDRTIAGNIYKLAGTSDHGALSYAGATKNPGTIDLRLPQGYPVGATMQYRLGNTGVWTLLSTKRTGNDIYEAPFVGLGEYALIPGAAAQANRSSNGNLIPIAVIALFIMLIVGSVIAIRLRAGRRPGGKSTTH